MYSGIISELSQKMKPGVYLNVNNITVYKKVLCAKINSVGKSLYYTKGVVELEIPAKSDIVVPIYYTNTESIRTDCAIVKKITFGELDDTESFSQEVDNTWLSFSHYDPTFIYKKDTIVKPNEPLCLNPKKYYVSGIHACTTYFDAYKYDSILLYNVNSFRELEIV
ncbi:hypothetical protein QLL95_gp1152 [Cotonvirus japonicus]|uniref:Uncharacterized protein n=1 Tax=Cotonvirus japonicus TaxID=2811091 RepID=A0ABM7NS49_9VIRU|nr:hypothetical protein QLL95_gp1152 [Cotonvirus japonicus]BCS82971.1 hypothetical protein [Cotonvirus japonicus]